MQLRLVLIQPRVVARLRAMTLSRSMSTQAAGTGAPSAAAATPQPLPSRRPRSGLVLGIESSCDDTGVAVVTTSGRVLGESLATQAEIHAAWGGVVPKLAQEAHEAAIDGCVEAALSAAGVTADQLDAVAVTIGPGLGLCLRVRYTHTSAAVLLCLVRRSLSWLTRVLVQTQMQCHCCRWGC
jgi:N6-L-threonylcarbamoyladenine synthase